MPDGIRHKAGMTYTLTSTFETASFTFYYQLLTAFLPTAEHQNFRLFTFIVAQSIMKNLPLLLLLASHFLFAQSPSQPAGLNNLARLYDQHLGANAMIYTGARFTDDFANRQTTGNYYYHTNDWATGTVSFLGRVYDSVTLRYNLLTNQLILLNNYTGESLVAQKEKVDFFEIHNTRFVFLTNPEPGYYAQLSNGTIKPYARYTCFQIEKNLNGSLLLEMKMRKRYFLQKDGIFYPVKSRSSALNVFGSKKNELKRKLKQEGIHYNSQKEKALALLSQYYDQTEK